MENTLYLNVFICATGLLLHIFMKWGEARSAIPNKEAKPGLLQYVGDVPAQTGIAIIGTVAATTDPETGVQTTTGAGHTGWRARLSCQHPHANR